VLIACSRPHNVTDKALGTTHGLDTLHPGTKVTCYLRVPTPERASIRFFAYDSKSQHQWAPETPEGGEAQLPTDSAWKRYDWTVPNVDIVHAIGIEIYQFTDDPVINLARRNQLVNPDIPVQHLPLSPKAHLHLIR
jgi:hypothetical protein